MTDLCKSMGSTSVFTTDLYKTMGFAVRSQPLYTAAARHRPPRASALPVIFSFPMSADKKRVDMWGYPAP